jgi:protein-disulfide isomerase
VEIRDPNNESSLAAQAAMCAAEQDKYLEMTDKLFGNYGGVQQGAYKRANLNRFAEDLDLDMNAFNGCMDSGRYVPVLADSVAQGQNQGITATPMFIIDNGNGAPNVVQQTAEGYDLMKKQIQLAIDTAP